MDQQQFDALVARLEGQAAAHPVAYRAKLFLLACLGYGYVAGVVLALGLLGAGLVLLFTEVGSGVGVLVKPLVAILSAMVVVARTLWVRVEPPTGIPLARREAPRFFAMLHELRRALRTPRVHHVLVTDDFNASVVQVPTLGIFGWQRNYLVVGLPLLAAVPPEQARAVIAHELAHLSRAHGRFATWIYRVRATVDRLHALSAQDPAALRRFYRRFIDWYAPKFDAHSFVLARHHEYEADRLAAEVAGRDEMARALVALEVRGRQVARGFWPSLWRGASEHAEAPADVYARLAAYVREPLDEARARGWAADALEAPAASRDTHPSLARRLEALFPGTGSDAAAAERVALPTPPAVSGAQHYLDAALPPLRARLDAEWRGAAQPNWRRRHETVRAAREGLAALAEAERAAPLDDEALWNRAGWVEELDGSTAALPHYRQLLDRGDALSEPYRAPTLYAVGRCLLGAGDAGGIALVDRAMALDADAILAGCELVHKFLVGAGREAEAIPYRDRYRARAALLEEAERERTWILPSDPLRPAALPEATVSAILEQLTGTKRIAVAYLVRKDVRHFPEQPLYVLGLVPRWNLFRWESVKRGLERDRAEVAALVLPGGVKAFIVQPGHYKLRRALARVPGSRVFDARVRRARRRAARAGGTGPATATA